MTTNPYDDAPAPPDIVAKPGLTRETVLFFNDSYGKPVTLTEPGKPIYGPDGDLIGMSESTTTPVATLGKLKITTAQAAEFELTQEMIPNVIISDD